MLFDLYAMITIMTNNTPTQPVDDVITPARILDVAREQVRRFGENKTNVVDIARARDIAHDDLSSFPLESRGIRCDCVIRYAR